MEQFFRLIRKYEPWLFLLVVIVLLSENFISQWMITLDGPAHMYNSIVARDLLTNPSSDFAPFFQINTNPVPNSLDHLILMGLGSFLPLSVADQILHLIIVAGICFAFRFLVLQVNREQVFASWIIFPFCQTAIYFLGFYNFELGVFLCLLSTAIWIRSEKTDLKTGTVLLLMLLSTLLYFTHLVPFLLMVMIAGLRLLTLLIRKDYKQFTRRSAATLIALLPAIIVFAIYYSHRTENGNPPTWADWKESLNKLWSLKHLFLHDARQALPAMITGVLLLALVLYSALHFFIRKKTISSEARKRFGFWFLCWFIVFALIFISPDDFGGSGMMTARLIEISWVMLLLFIASSAIDPRIFVLTGFACAVLAFWQMTYHRPSILNMNTQTHKVLRFAPDIKPQSTAVYIPMSGNPFYGHLGELVFAEKKSGLLSNYETIHDFFIVKWQDTLPAQYSIGGLSPTDLNWIAGGWHDAPGKPQRNIDYVLLCKEYVSDSATFKRLNDTLNSQYVLKRQEEPFYLYEAKQRNR